MIDNSSAQDLLLNMLSKNPHYTDLALQFWKEVTLHLGSTWVTRADSELNLADCQQHRSIIHDYFEFSNITCVDFEDFNADKLLLGCEVDYRDIFFLAT